MITQADIVERVKDAVPEYNGTPSTSQYLSAARNAALDFSRAYPMRRLFTLSIVSGTASYALPSDFLELIELPKISAQTQGPGNVLVTDELIPLSTAAGTAEQIEIIGLTLSIIPTPLYTLDRQLSYKAGYVVENSEDYVGMLEAHKEIVILKASANALLNQAAAEAGSNFSWAEGGDKVDKKGQAAGFELRAQALIVRYEFEVKKLIGARGQRS